MWGNKDTKRLCGPGKATKLIRGRRVCLTPSLHTASQSQQAVERWGLGCPCKSHQRQSLADSSAVLTCNYQVTLETVPAGSLPGARVSSGSAQLCRAFSAHWFLWGCHFSLISNLNPNSKKPSFTSSWNWNLVPYFCSRQTSLYSAIIKMLYFFPKQATCQNK